MIDVIVTYSNSENKWIAYDKLSGERFYGGTASGVDKWLLDNSKTHSEYTESNHD